VDNGVPSCLGSSSPQISPCNLQMQLLFVHIQFWLFGGKTQTEDEAIGGMHYTIVQGYL